MQVATIQTVVFNKLEENFPSRSLSMADSGLANETADVSVYICIEICPTMTANMYNENTFVIGRSLDILFKGSDLEIKRKKNVTANPPTIIWISPNFTPSKYKMLIL